MYALINSNDIQVKFNTYCERMPDGRLIVPFNKLKMLGSVANLQVVATGRELLAMIEEQKKSGLYNDKPTTMLPEEGEGVVEVVDEEQDSVDDGFIHPEPPIENPEETDSNEQINTDEDGFTE